jgi:hypothetical protein
MKQLLVLLLACCFYTGNGQATEWSTQDRSLLAGAVVFHIFDWGQTRTIAKNTDIWKEYNPVLGTHPGVGKVNNYFLATAIAIPLLAHFIPDWRSQILGAWLLVEVGAVTRNYHIGIRMTW